MIIGFSTHARDGWAGGGGGDHSQSFWGQSRGGFMATPAFILPPLLTLPPGNGNDVVIPTVLTGDELKNSLKALKAVIKTSTNRYPFNAPMQAQMEFRQLAKFMQKNPGGYCYNAGSGMVCTGANGKSSTYNYLTTALVSRTLAKKDGNTLPSVTAPVNSTVAAVNDATDAAYAAYLAGNAGTVSAGSTQQTAFSNAPAVVLPQSSNTSGTAVVSTK
jgi:hypothetical protein